ncbi:MAG: PorT family protein [Bacteroidales bacterium]|nr:PorT family protein [Bacteroidales bacterium]
MKKLWPALLGLLLCLSGTSQILDDNARKKFTFGFDLFSDIWQDLPETIDAKTLNPGISAYGTYNFILGESNFSFSPGLGVGVHNLFNDALPVLVDDSTVFIKVPDTVSYKRVKFTTTYLDIPMEFRFKSKKQFRFAVGFKFGFLVKGQTKYKGNDVNDHLVIEKISRIRNIEKNRYGFTARIGYKWLNLMGYYSLSSLFAEGKGPEMYPISIGLTIIPF